MDAPPEASSPPSEAACGAFIRDESRANSMGLYCTYRAKRRALQMSILAMRAVSKLQKIADEWTGAGKLRPARPPRDQSLKP
jgi:hypothetical protein